MRKRFIYLLVLSLLLGGLQMSVFAETAFDKDLESAIIRVKDLFNITDEYDTFDSQVSSTVNRTYFYLNWSDSNNKLENINVTTDSIGNIISFNKYNPIYLEPESKLPKYSREESHKLAVNFLKKIDPIAAIEIKLENNASPINSNDLDYNFYFTRLINGIPYPDNYLNVNVNKYTGEINNYYTNWDRGIAFPSAENIISIENGKQSFRNKIGLDLMYKSSYRMLIDKINNEETKYFLAYSIMNNNKAIDAITGEVINISNYGYGMGAENEKSMDSSAESAAVITPEERAEIEKFSGIIEIKAVEKFAREELGLDSGYLLQNKNLYSNYKNPGDFQWSLYFTKKVDDNNTVSADITLDAKNAEILSFYRYLGHSTNSNALITKDEALQMAKDYIAKMQSNKVNQVELIKNELSDGKLSYDFRFVRKADDIYVESDSIYVGVDAINKQIISYSMDWFKGNLPSRQNLIGLEKAYETFFNDIGYELKYIAIYDYEKPEGENKEIKLVYSENSTKPSIIDAHSGEILDYSGEPFKENKAIEYTDIDDSYAKDKIITLAEYGVSFTSQTFMPKESIKQRDFMYLIFKSMYPYRTENENEEEIIYDELTRSNIIKEGERNLDRVVTKEEAVKFVIRAMKYDKVAQIQEIYKDIFLDSSTITSNLKGHINIAYGLKIITGDGTGNINPKAVLNREDAASIIYNYIFN